MLYIAPLLVILHHIPLARRALLNDSNDIVPYYGFEHEWWNGELIDLSGEFENSNDSIHSYARMMVETQRLMAFLDGGSRRSMAQIKNLALSPPISSLPSLKGEFPDMNPVGRFLEDLVKFAGYGSLLSNVFETAAVHSPTKEVKTFSNFSTEVTVSLSPSDTLFDLVDDMVWPLPEAPETYLSNVADIITLSLRRDDAQSGAGIDVPLTFYPDRYTVQFVPFVKMLRDRRKEYQQRLGVLNSQRFTIMNYMGKDTSKLLQISSDYLTALVNRDENKDNEEEDSDDDDFDYTGLEAATEDLKNAAEIFAKKKLGMVEEMQAIQNEMNKESALFKGEDDRDTFEKVFPGQEYPPMRVFHLSGVILSPTEYCFCKLAEPALIELDDDSQHIEDTNDIRGDKPHFVWWKVSSSLGNQAYEMPTVTQISVEELLALAKNGSTDYGSQEVVLIYATENAWQEKEHNIALSPALQTFIDDDRRSLLAALREEEVASVVLERDSTLPNTNPFLREDEDESRIEVQSIDDEGDVEIIDSGVSVVSPKYAASSDSSAGEEITTGLMKEEDADAMELEFGVKKVTDK